MEAPKCNDDSFFWLYSLRLFYFIISICYWILFSIILLYLMKERMVFKKKNIDFVNGVNDSYAISCFLITHR